MRDAELLKRIEVGEQGALAELYDCYSPLIYTYAVRLCRDRVSAEEVLHQVFLQVWRTPAQFTLEQELLENILGLLGKKLAAEIMLRRKHEGQRMVRHALAAALPPTTGEVSIDHLHF